jgi:cell division protein ZapE
MKIGRDSDQYVLGALTPAQLYARALDADEVLADPAQQRVVDLLQVRYVHLLQNPPQRPSAASRLLGKLGLVGTARVKAQESVRGLYLWGGVGRGKTMMMDMFCGALPVQRRQRMHFHRFMRRVHDALGRHAGRANPLLSVADEIAAAGDVLCFDEFFVSDIGDAMILGEVMTALFQRGVTLIATSNVEPAHLYENGLQRARFLPAIDEIYAHCDVHHIDAGQDFRLRALQQAKLYHFPLNEQARLSMEENFAGLAAEEARVDVSLSIENRPIRARKVAGDVVWFDFTNICEGPRSQNDYIEVATLFTTVLVSNVPVLDTTKEDAARRFISLVDEFYDRRVKLILSADHSIADLYQGHRLSFEFQRTESRLLEMQSESYLSEPHVS